MNAPKALPTRDRAAAALLILALVVALVRFVRLGEWSLWIDEVFTLADSQDRLEAANPLGYALWRLWLSAVGDVPNELDLRLPAAILGWLCVPLLAFAARPFVGARPAALAALLLAVSSWHVYWSQCARFYTLAMALSLLGIGLWATARERLFQRGVGLLLAALAALAHPSAALVLPGLVIAPLLVRDRVGALHARVRVLHLVAVALTLVAAAFWALPILADWDAVKGIASPAHLVLSSGFFLTPMLGVAALLGLADIGTRRDHPALVLAIATVGAWALAVAISLFMRVSAQYVFVLLPFTIVLAVAPLARGAVSAPRLAGFAAVAHAFLLTAPLLTGTFLYLTVRNGEREPWREAYAVVAAQRHAGDLVLGMSAPVGQFYLAPGSRDLREPTALEYLDRWRYPAVPFAAHLGRRTWFVVNHERLTEWPEAERNELRRILREDCRLVADFPLQIESRDLSLQVFLREG